MTWLLYNILNASARGGGGFFLRRLVLVRTARIQTFGSPDAPVSVLFGHPLLRLVPHPLERQFEILFELDVLRAQPVDFRVETSDVGIG